MTMRWMQDGVVGTPSHTTESVEVDNEKTLMDEHSTSPTQVDGKGEASKQQGPSS